METVTYSLKTVNPNSEEYYKQVRTFTGEVLTFAAEKITPIVHEYMGYLKNYNLEPLRETEEYILEVLSFGILWRTYANRALRVRVAPFITMARMAEWRKKHQQIKPAIDFARGILMTLFLLPKDSKNQEELPSIEHIDHVIKWFEATGEFREQALRFIRWRAYWTMKDPQELNYIFSAINEFTTWFEEKSEQALGSYTQNVNGFLQSSVKKYRWREDRISCMRSRSEYHLNMVGAELMNRAFKDEFTKTDVKVVLVPGCMRAKIPELCEAVKVKEGLKCSGCVPECRVNHLRRMGEKSGFDVYIIPHASDLSLWSPVKGKPVRGVIASACVTTIVEGGWELKRYDVPAQCVLLDYSGCQKHWHTDGIPTELNVRELKRIFFGEKV